MACVMARDPLQEDKWRRLITPQSKTVLDNLLQPALVSQDEALHRLQRLATWAGWHPDQRRSVEAALAAPTMSHTRG